MPPSSSPGPGELERLEPTPPGPVPSDAVPSEAMDQADSVSRGFSGRRGDPENGFLEAARQVLLEVGRERRAIPAEQIELTG